MSERIEHGIASTKKPVTIQDVAQHAHVSIATVSRVLNGITTVDAEMASRVRAACAALHYHPNRAARALAGGRPVLIGCVVADLLNPFFVEVIQGIEDTMHRYDYLLVLCNSAQDPGKERKYIEVLCAERVAGVIIVPKQQRYLSVFRQHNIPVVTVDQRAHDRTFDAVLIDNVGAAREAVAHLIGNGYQRIGMITGPLQSTTGHDRLEGYRLALRDAGIVHDPAIERSGSFEEESGRRYANELLDVQPPIEALVTGNNRITLGAMKTIHARGLHIPDDIAIVCFDDVPWASPGSIALTTIVQPAYELGKTAAMRLVQRLQHPEQSSARQEIVLAHHLHIGASSPPRLVAPRTTPDGPLSRPAQTVNSIRGQSITRLT